MADADRTSPWRMNGRVSHVRKEHPHGCDYQGCRLHLCGVGPQLRRGNCQQDDRSGRFIIHKFTPGAGHVLRISGRRVPANSLSRQSVSTCMSSPASCSMPSMTRVRSVKEARTGLWNRRMLQRRALPPALPAPGRAPENIGNGSNLMWLPVQLAGRSGTLPMTGQD